MYFLLLFKEKNSFNECEIKCNTPCYFPVQTEKLDPEMKALFEEIGLNDHSQVDEDTIDFIYDFVGKHGGLQALREDLARRKPPAVPPSSTG